MAADEQHRPEGVEGVQTTDRRARLVSGGWPSL